MVDNNAVYIEISTHSLTRRLTTCEQLPTKRKRYFNSQPHKEADGTQEGRANRKLIFQLTASQGG